MKNKGEIHMDNFKRLEELVLEEAVRSSEPVKIYLVNGYQAKAVIQDFDAESILAKVNGHNWLIYRNAVSAIELG